MDTQWEINDQHADRIEYLERKVFELIEVVNLLSDNNNRLADSIKKANDIVDHLTQVKDEA